MDIKSLNEYKSMFESLSLKEQTVLFHVLLYVIKPATPRNLCTFSITLKNINLRNITYKGIKIIALVTS